MHRTWGQGRQSNWRDAAWNLRIGKDLQRSVVPAFPSAHRHLTSTWKYDIPDSSGGAGLQWWGAAVFLPFLLKLHFPGDSFLPLTTVPCFIGSPYLILWAPGKKSSASSSASLTSFTAMSFKTILFVYLWLCWLGLFLCSRGFFSCSKRGLLSHCRAQASHCGGFSCCWVWVLGCISFRSCGTWAYLPRSMWDLLGPGIEPVSPALAGFLDHQQAS